MMEPFSRANAHEGSQLGLRRDGAGRVIRRAEIHKGIRGNRGKIREEAVFRRAGHVGDARVAGAAGGNRACGADHHRTVDVDRISGVLHGDGHIGTEKILKPTDIAFSAVGDKNLLAFHYAVIENLGDFRPECGEARLVAIARVTGLGTSARGPQLRDPRRCAA